MLVETLTTWAARFPSGVAIADDEETLTWSELAARVATHRARLNELGVARAVLHLPQTASALALVFACACEGIDAILVSRIYPESRVEAARRVTGVADVLTLEGRDLVATTGAPRAGSRSPSPIVGVLTSGTTGEPKCAEHSWETLARAVKPSARRAEKRWLLCYPISHIAALQVVTQCIVNRAALVIPADSGPEAAIRSVLRHRVECVSSTPTFMRNLLRHAERNFWKDAPLEQIVLGGEIVSASILEALREAAPHVRVTHVYATTELGTVIVVGDGREGFDAKLLDGERLRVSDGELWVRRSDRSMRRYSGRADVTDAWWPTGDLVEVDGERVRFRGRLSDVINVGGSKVMPAEVEAVLRGVEGVAEVSVVAHPSSLAGNLVKAIVQAIPGADPGRLKADAVARCRARLATHMVPRLFEFVDEIPTTATHKKQRAKAHDA